MTIERMLTEEMPARTLVAPVRAVPVRLAHAFLTKMSEHAAMGCRGQRADDLAALAPALQKAFAAPESEVIDVFSFSVACADATSPANEASPRQR